MRTTYSAKRPWLAAVLAALVTGLGHLYLRRWRRAIGWLAALVATSYVLVEPAAVDALASGTVADPFAVLPILLVAGLSVADAYLLARAQNAVARVTVTPEGQLTHCPTCGRELETDLDFCHWCTTDVPDLDEMLDEEDRRR
ncbi:zinc ribbon domain-containing protein [Haloarcula salina]|uniref:Zinc ribbon domain-containing protein n=1 Tax=Haloarcula salina TaxID=1429914 RepID=A0AA41G1H9_9EURY|nr:zinc ribbon domain-containing protein [Haloarcula salina]MBV0902672.1 zinc ribbon domain-containing protein [Haloarcula salina]